MKLGFGLSLVTQGGGTPAPFAVALTGLTNGEAIIGDHASISYTTDPVSATETVKWSNSANPADAATYGTGANPTDFTAGDEGRLYLHVTDDGATVTASALIRYARGTAPAVADGQVFVVFEEANIDGSASGANLTFTYALSGVAGTVAINSGTGLITGQVFSLGAGGTATITATDQYGLEYTDTFTWTREAAPVISGVPTISGTETQGETLTATAGSVTGEPTPSTTWQWERSGTNITGATSATYTLVADDVGETLTVVQTETNTHGSDTAESAATGTIVADWTPADLFAGSEQGVWYDVHPDYLFQNSNGTTAVSVGDVVGYVTDRSGNGIHATQPTTSAKPILRQAGAGEYYLEFDGVDDCLLLGDVFDTEIATTNGKFDAYAAARFSSDSILLSKQGDTSQSEDQRQYIAIRRNSGKSNQVAVYNLDDASQLTIVDGDTITADADTVFRSVFDQSLAAAGTTANTTARHKAYQDGTEETLVVSNSNGNLGTIQNGSAQLCIGGTFGTAGPLAGPFDGRLYGFVMMAGEVLSAGDAEDTETYLSGKMP